MNKIATLSALAIGATTMSASAVDLGAVLCIDYSVANTITITATDGLAANTVSGGDTTGFYFADLFTSAAAGVFSDVLIGGNLTSAANTSDGTPSLFTFVGSFGLNVFSYTDDATSDFSFGSIAFSGSATWSINSADYAALVAGNLGGDIYAFADDDGDLPGATFIGTWKVVPTPSSLALLSLGGLVGARRRR